MAWQFEQRVDIPESLHEAIKQRAHQTGTSMRMSIVRALEQSYAKPGNKGFVTGPPVVV